MNPLKELHDHGQSVWLDYIRRNLVRSGELKRLVEEDGIRGVTSNPTIFEKAIAGSTDYDDALRELLARNGKTDVEQLYEPLAIEDIQMAADVLRPVFDQSGGDDGYVSLEVSPRLANDTQGTIDAAKRLRAAVSRPNVMIKVPATPAGIPAIESLIADGISVNVTLMFSMKHYEDVARAYINGLQRCADPSKVASVASFFVSRVDTVVDKALESNGSPEAKALCGKIAIANSKVVYRRFQEIFHGEGFAGLRQRGARVQRPLWASTGTKNPAYSDVLYVENLIGPETVNTLPPDTIAAFRDHGKLPGATVKEGWTDADEALAALPRFGIDLDAVTEKLQADGVTAFAASFDQLLSALDKKRKTMVGVEINRQELRLGKSQRRVDNCLKAWQAEQFGSRLWKKDHKLWVKEPEPELTDRLGWLELPDSMEQQVAALGALADQVKAEGMKHVVLLGMGGSSLAPEVFQQTFANAAGYPALIMLDSTHPRAVKPVEARIDLARTIFLVSSKSGTTTETNSFFFYFWDKVTLLTGEPGRHFVAITDPGTPLEKLAAARKFRATFSAPVEVGGRYSALTVFGLVPAALIGVDVSEILMRARRMSQACSAVADAKTNPGLILGAALGELALAKRDKVTFLCSPSLAAFPAWVEQLIAESTGKNRKGIVPVAGEAVGAPDKYSNDRFFVYLRLKGDDNHTHDRLVAALEANGHPVATIDLNDKYDIGQEFFRWEMAIAAAGAVLEINPFNQPDVQLAKDLAKKAMDANAGSKKSAASVKDEVAVSDNDALHSAVATWLDNKRAYDYVVVQAYIYPSSENSVKLQTVCAAIRDRLGVATTLGFGPRFLHSTGQLHKGGPNSALVLQLVDQPTDRLAVPETTYTFDELIQAQGIGDFTALKQRRRRVLRVNLGNDSTRALEQLTQALKA
ncbi:MAG: bifunctional transaldolase/phosoglucose isomerase [Deltaproteobacteria bacterium]|nr:bifunctional transaldolase/phosoglucose isomerase [Deltaproteobacteria bacterium]MBM4296585.1 bifunctional transaldolase/phosoglucose isomerase [Deltaproteobacteria bacterium]